MDAIVFVLEKHADVEHITHRSFHSLRRSFATLLIDEDLEYTTASQLLGHCDFSTDKCYISFNKDKVSRCAMDFTHIPISGGIYHEIY